MKRVRKTLSVIVFHVHMLNFCICIAVLEFSMLLLTLKCKNDAAKAHTGSNSRPGAAFRISVLLMIFY